MLHIVILFISLLWTLLTLIINFVIQLSDNPNGQFYIRQWLLSPITSIKPTMEWIGEALSKIHWS